MYQQTRFFTEIDPFLRTQKLVKGNEILMGGEYLFSGIYFNDNTPFYPLRLRNWKNNLGAF